MSAVGPQPTETYEDLNAIIRAINRMTVPPVKNCLKFISDSNLISGSYSTKGLKKELNDRLVAHFVSLKEQKMGDQYRESRRILEEQFGAPIIANNYRGQGFSYSGPNAAQYGGHSSNTASTSSNNPYYHPQAKQSPYATPPTFAGPSYTMGARMGSSSLSASSSTTNHSYRRPHFRPTPFLQIKDWVGPVIIISESPGSQQKAAAVLKLQLTAANLELLRQSTAIHQLRLFCTNKSYYDASLNPNHPAPVEFPMTAEVKVNHIPLSINLKGKKTAAKVLAPDINKDHALYFGGQDNKVELLYHATTQKYVMGVAICEVRHADTLARRIRREKFRSKEDVLGAMKRAADDDDIEMGDISMGLKCPLSYMRLTTPIRASVCVHMQCFDAFSFFSINEQTPAWQCPICFKSINPDSLFTDGFVQDILEKVPEEEETVLIDSEGRWHTPNKKFYSDSRAASTSIPQSDNNVKSTNGNGNPVTPQSEANRSLKSEFPSGTTPPLKRPRSAILEVFEIDDDDDEDETYRPSQRPEVGSIQKEVQVPPTSEPEMYLPGFPPTSIMAGSNNRPTLTQSLIPPSNPRSTVDPALQAPTPPRLLAPPPPPPQLPTLPAAATVAPLPEKPACEVIDLTLSDSEDETSVPPPRLPNTATHTIPLPPARKTSFFETIARPGGTLSSAPRSNQLQSVIPSSTSNEAQVVKNASAASTNGAHSNQQSHTNGTGSNGNGSNSSFRPQAIPQLVDRRTSTPRRSSSIFDEEDGDDSQPILPHRKRGRLVVGSDADDEDEGEEFVRRSSSENSEGLYEEERAGLAIRR